MHGDILMGCAPLSVALVRRFTCVKTAILCAADDVAVARTAHATQPFQMPNSSAMRRFHAGFQANMAENPHETCAKPL
jgi:hypothetical protein